ncbi:MAG: TatD family hydrolase [Thiobacillaceae bacterium]|nr:TatD family hydrolase [Thiobacillaceae bacterium]MDW8324224.1 TatD family hydrolase [Burkholderiales bacterium]
MQAGAAAVRLIDSHCHLDFPDYTEGVQPLLERMSAAGVTHALCVSVSLERLPAMLALVEPHANLYASVGVHPDHEDAREPTVEELVRLAQHPKVVALGETGLDYYRQPREAVEWQRARFRTHIRAARAIGKPLIVHMRNAAEDTLAILAEEGAREVGGVMHCFTETWAVAEQAMALGFYISFSGIVTFKNAAELREVARAVPLDRLLIETDSPYLAPVPHRGKRNEPAYVRHVAETLAQVKGLPVEEVAQASWENFFRLFRPATA